MSELAPIAQIPTSEPTPQAPAAPAMDSERFAALAKRETALVKEQQSVKAEKIKAEEITKRNQQFEETRKTDPVAAMRMLGFTETEIFNWLAASEKKELTPEEKADAIARKAAQETIDADNLKKAQEQEKLVQERDHKLITGYKAQMNQFIEVNAEKYPYCKAYGPGATTQAYENLLEVIKETKGEDIPTTEDLFNALEELYEQRDIEMDEVSKRKQRFTPKEPIQNNPVRNRVVDKVNSGTEPPRQAIAKTRTLHNSMGGSNLTAPKGPETKEQKRERLINAVRRGAL